MRDNRRFGKGGTYRCDDCRKLTRETGEGESECGLCRRCFLINGLENLYADGRIDRAEFDARLAELKAEEEEEEEYEVDDTVVKRENRRGELVAVIEKPADAYDEYDFEPYF